MNQMLCEHCFPEGVEIAPLGGEIVLFKNGDQYGLMGMDGHKGHEWFYFPVKPFPDPDPKCVIDSPNEDVNAWIDSLDALEEIMKMDPSSGHIFVESCKQVGWGPDCGQSMLSVWLMNHCSKLVMDYEAKLNA